MSTIRDRVSKLSDDQAKRQADAASSVDRRKAVQDAMDAATQADNQVTQDDATIESDHRAIAAAVSEGSPSGFAVDFENPNADGTFNMLVVDSSPQGYHITKVVDWNKDVADPAAPTADAPPTDVPPAEMPPVEVPTDGLPPEPVQE